MRSVALVIAFLVAISITGIVAAVDDGSGPTIVGEPVKPVVLNEDLSKLPGEQPWKEGEPIIQGEEPGEPPTPPEIAGPAKIGGSSEQVAKGETIQGQTSNSPQAVASTQTTGADPISVPIINIEGIPADGKIPPDTVGDVGPNHYIQMVNVRFAIFDKAGNVLVGKTGSVVGGININQLWIDAGQGNDACGSHNDGDPVVKYDRMADRWVLSQFVAFSNFCVAVSQTPDPVAGGWFLYDFPTNGIPNDYPKMGVWPDAYYVGTNNMGGGGDAWAFDRINMIAGGVARPPIRFFAGTGFWLPSDLYGSLPPAGAPNVFARFVQGSPDHVALREFHVDFANPPASTFTALPDIPTAAFNSNFCGALGFRIACIPQPGTGQLLDVLNGELMYRLQYRNFGSHETLVLNHDINVGSNQAGNRWYELRKSGGAWSIFQQGTNSPDATNRWMGSIAMDKGGNIALGYSVSSGTVFPGLRYTGRLASDPPGTLQAESTLIAGGGSQLPTQCTNGPCGNRWGDYSSLSVDPVDDCTFWYTGEHYPTNSAGGWHTRIGSFGYCGSISGMKYNDLNGNGVKDIGDTGLPNWLITLKDSNNNIVATKTTASDGTYSFIGLPQGTYTVLETLQPGWIQTAPAPIPPGAYTVTISAGERFRDKDFGNFKFGEVHGQKFEDLNANGIKDPGEVGLAGWKITLTGTDTITNTPITLTTTTDASGNYQFTGLTAGTYTITETLLSGWVQTAPSTGKFTETITSGAVINGDDFGNFHKGDITGGGSIGITGGKATFGIVGHYPDSTNVAQGSVEYQDKVANLNVKSTQINTVASTLDKKKGAITGLAQVNGKGSFPFVVNVEDNGEPGKGTDKFSISIPAISYTNGAILSGGNIQIHS